MAVKRASSESTALLAVPSGFLASGAHYGLTGDAAAALPFLPLRANKGDVHELATTLRAAGVETSLAGYAAEFSCSLLAMAHAHDRGDDPTSVLVGAGELDSGRSRPGGCFDGIINSIFPIHSSEESTKPAKPCKPPLSERMVGFERRAAVDCALAAGWACIATLASTEPARWRTTCYALADVFGLKMRDLDRITVQSIHRARYVVGA